jgi:hypothetical protein
VFGVAAWVCLLFIVEVLARVHVLDVRPFLVNGGQTGVGSMESKVKDETAELDAEHAGGIVMSSRVLYDYVKIASLLRGPKGAAAAMAIVGMYCWGVLWAFAAVFASQASSLFFSFFRDGPCNIYLHPSDACNATYGWSLGIFALVVTTLTVVGVAEQKYVQLSMTVYRFVAFGVMIVTVVTGLALGPEPSGGVRPPAVDWNGFSDLFVTAAVAANFHYNCPDILFPLRNKRSAVWVAQAALLTALAFYVTFGLLAAYFFGPQTLPLVTLNWSQFTGFGKSGWGNLPDGHTKARTWARVVQGSVMMFPVLDMISVFPIVAVTLASNLESTLRPHIPQTYVSDRVLTYLARLLAAVPPIILAALVGDLESIFSFTGLFAFFLQLVFPALFYIWSFTADRTAYTNVFSSVRLAKIILVGGLISFAFALFAVINKFAGWGLLGH